MKKSISKKETHTGEELKRYLGALHEEHMDGLKAMGEQFADVNRKLDSHTEMIGGLAVRMTSMEQKIVHMEMSIAVMQEDIGFIKSGMKRKVDQDEFDALIRRVSVLERRVLK
ncbi:MAG TPA: hypothetical protein VJJ55_01205 [Candidatus Paceibacterota bacterium]